MGIQAKVKALLTSIGPWGYLGSRSLAATVVVLFCLGSWAGAALAAERPPVVILTDIGKDPDDQQSLVRALLYSNELSIRGIVPTYIPTGPVRTDLVLSMLAAYKKDLSSLRRHDKNYPSAELLLSRVKAGLNTNTKIGAGYDSDGSNLIVYMVDHSAEPIWVLVWGGSRELAQALYKVKTQRSAAAYQSFQKKLRVYTIEWSQYTPEPGDWMKTNAKDMFWIASVMYEHVRSATFRGMYLEGDHSQQSAGWLSANILNHGNLGPQYPLNTTERGLKEGDSPSLLHILPVGLHDPEAPYMGGWGGRYTKETPSYRISKNLYTSQFQLDTVDGITSRQMSVARWRDAFQRDFVARAKWLDTSYGAANHPPEAVVASNTITASSGDTVTLDASRSSDPDGDALSYKWWIYNEMSSYDGDVTIADSSSAKASLKMPEVSSKKSIHVILEVTDKATDKMTRYQRVVVTVNP